MLNQVQKVIECVIIRDLATIVYNYYDEVKYNYRTLMQEYTLTCKWIDTDETTTIFNLGNRLLRKFNNFVFLLQLQKSFR